MEHPQQHFPSPRYSAFTQRVRRYRPSQLIPALASFTARRSPSAHTFDELRSKPPWATIAIARESVVRGNERRARDVTEDEIRTLIQLHHEVFERPTRATVTAILGPLLYEQGPWHSHTQSDLARALILFGDSSLAGNLDWTEVLGMTLAEAMRASLLISVLVGQQSGRWAPDLLDQYYQHQEWRDYVPRAFVESLANLLTKSVSELREAARREEEGLGRFDPELRKLPFNPLHLNPLVRLDNGEVWAPEHWLLWRIFLQENLYARARKAFGDQATRLLGQRVQAYAGHLLETTKGRVIPEFTYGKGGGSDTIDWFWVTDTAVILVECKSFGLHLSARAGGGMFDEQVQRTIVKARSQIDRTAQAMGDGRISRPEVPTSLPVYGLIVTSDPVPLANTGAPEFGPRGTTQTLVASLTSLERLCALESEDPAQVLLRIFQDDERRTWDLEQSLPKPDQAKYRNPPPIDAALTSLRPRPTTTGETTS